jgi:tetratricopeptide (TPR) repeat protein
MLIYWGDRMNRSFLAWSAAAVSSLAGAVVVSLALSTAASARQVCDQQPGQPRSCGEVPDGPRGSGGVSVPAGPTQEELRQQREEKDLNEAAQDADDKGIAAYRNGDFAAAIRYFTEALSYEPDDGDIKQNLALAQQHLAEAQNAAAASASARALKAAAQDKGTTGDNETISGQARKGFDNAGRDAGTLTTSPSYAGSGGGRDPVVPAAKRNAAIDAMEKARATDRKKIAALKAEMKTLDPKTDPVKIGKIKNDISTAESDAQYQNFSINDALEKPSVKSAQ